MTGLTPAEKTIRAGELVADSLEPFLAANAPEGGEIKTWLRVLEAKDVTDGRAPLQRDINDARVRLQILARFWRAFRFPTTPQQTRWASEVLQTLNTAAHVPATITDLTYITFLGISQKLVSSLDAESNGLVEINRLVEDALHIGPPSTVTSAPVETEATPPEPEFPVTSHPRTEHATAAGQTSDLSLAPAMLASANHPDEPFDALPNLRNTTNAEEERSQSEDAYKRFAPHIQTNPWGLEFEFISVGSMRMVIAYRQDLNYALAHNRVSVLAGIGIFFDDPEGSDATSHAITGLSAHLGSLAEEDRYRWNTPDLAILSREYWVADQSALAWNLPPESFIDVDEAQPETLELEFSVDGQVVQRSLPLRTLAHDQWSPSTVPETIAAFIRPRSEAVSSILLEASDLLATRTGDPSLVGYQDSPERTVETAKAIYDAIRSFEIRYAEPPSSFEETGQKVRDSQTVLTKKFGTCLDTTVLFAAVLEEAGIQPFVAILRGHALVGFTTREIVTDMVISGRGAIDNLVGSGIFIPIETTLCTAGKNASFADATEQGHATLLGRRGIRLIVNVQAAHRRVQPLPTIVSHDGSRTIVLTEDRPILPKMTATAREAGTDETRSLVPGGYPYRVGRWRSDLLDLTFRNPLLKLSDSRALKVLLPGEDVGSLEDRLAAGEIVRLTPHDDVDDIDLERGITSAAEYEPGTLSRLFREEGRTFVQAQRGRTDRRLTTLRREARSLREETGANALFVSLGLLKWKSAGRDGRTQEGRSPLFLLPVELTGSPSRPYSIRVEPNAEIQPNFCLIEKLRLEYELELPQLENPPVDDSGIDLPRIFSELRTLFLERGLNFSIEGRAHLGLFRFASLDMWRDVSDNWEALAQNRVVDHLIHRPGDLFTDPVSSDAVVATDEADLHLPLPADGSQLEAIKAATAGRTFVLEGPPGTGKSQTITNMIADGVAHGRSVLFVAEKQAALSIVKDRLTKVGLEPLVLDVHGRDQSLNKVRAQIKASIQATRSANPAAFNTSRSLLRNKIEDLEAYPSKIHSRLDGESIWERYQRCLTLERQYPDGPGWAPEDIPVTRELLGTHESEIRARASAVHTAAQRAQGMRLATEWAFIGLPSSRSAREPRALAAELASAARSVISAAEQIPESLQRLWERASSPQRESLSNWLASLSSGHAVLPRDLGAPRVTSAQLKQWQTDLSTFRTQWQPFASLLSPSSGSANIDDLRSEYDEAQKAGILKRSRYTKLAVDKIAIHVGTAHKPQVEKDPLRFLADLDAYRTHHDGLWHTITQAVPSMRRSHLLGDDAWPILEKAIAEAELYETHANETFTLLEVVPEAGDVLDELIHADPGAASSGMLNSSLEAFSQAWTDLLTLADATDESLDNWAADQPLFTRINNCAPAWLAIGQDDDARSEFERTLRLHEALNSITAIGLDAPARAIHAGQPTPHLAEAAILAVSREMLRHHLRTSDLDVFDTQERAETVEQYLDATKHVKRQMWNELPAQQLAERRGGGLVSVGLRKEIDRKRGGSIRNLFMSYGDDILALTPVVLMSPAAVAQFLPIDSVHFDTVIFDEASQIRVADAIGALGRAEAAVIVGDSKQMPPTNVFNLSASSEESEDTYSGVLDAVDGGEDAQAFILAATDQESILSEAVGSGIEQKWLSWHYRSRHESLISFSNIRYYEGNLHVFPGPPEARPYLGVSLKYVDGVFDSGKTRTNEQEVKAIVEEITSRLHADPSASIGVVTFNTQQRDLILDHLEQSPSPVVRGSLDREEEPLFVKNLENVQGDERDVILFSLAFSRNPETGVLRHNFGPLNNAGGERRLNVAITRARDAVILFTSIRSADIDPEKSRAEGVMHLKEYLRYAEQETSDPSYTSRQFTSEDLYREEVAERLRAEGLEVVTDLGSSKFRVDLAVRAGEHSGWLALTLDSPEWARRATTTDRDALPGEILQGVMGWRDTMQLLLPAWIRDKDAVVAEVVTRAETLRPPSTPDQAIHDAEIGPPLEEESTVTVSSELDDLEAPGQLAVPMMDEEINPLAPIKAVPAPAATEQPLAVDRSGEYEYVEASSEGVGDQQVLDTLGVTANAELVSKILSETIETEGPIEAQRLARLVAARFGLQKVRRNRLGQILKLVPYEPTRDATFGDFYWPTDIVPEEYTGFRPRVDGVGTMPVGEISHIEISNAMTEVLRSSGPLDQESLMREVMGIFGWSRLGSQIKERLSLVVQRLTEQARITIDNGDENSVLITLQQDSGVSVQ